MVFFFYYESSNLTLEQVDDMYTDPATNPWRSRSWVPKGYTSRREAAEDQKERDDVNAGIREDASHLEKARSGSSDGSAKSEHVKESV